MNKKHLIFLATIILVILGICIRFIYSKNITINEDDICIGTMYYSYMLGIDAGTEYAVHIYTNDEKVYKYEVTKGEITIAGSKEKNKEVGIITSKHNLIELNEKYKNRKSDNEELYIEYKIGDNDQVKDINDFIEEIFNYKKESD